MVKIGRREKQKNVNWTKIGECVYRFCRNRVEFIKNIENKGENAICIVGLGGMDAPASERSEQSDKYLLLKQNHRVLNSLEFYKIIHHQQIW